MSNIPFPSSSEPDNFLGRIIAILDTNSPSGLAIVYWLGCFNELHFSGSLHLNMALVLTRLPWSFAFEVLSVKLLATSGITTASRFH